MRRKLGCLLVVLAALCGAREVAAQPADGMQALVQALRQYSPDGGQYAGTFTPTPQQALERVDPAVVRDLAARSSAIQRNPRDIDALLWRGIDAEKAAGQSRYGTYWRHFAAVHFEQVLRLDPNNYYAHHNYAMNAFEYGDNTPEMPVEHLAITHFTKAIALKPDAARSYMGRGWAYLMVNDDAHADADFRRALQLDPKLQQELASTANDIKRRRGERGCIAGTLDRMGSYTVDRDARNANECTAHHGYWIYNECRQSTAMTPGAFPGESNCAPPRNGADMHYDPKAGGYFVR